MPLARAFWAGPLPELLAQLEATPAGLTTDEASRRLRLYGPNSLAGKARFATLVSFLRFLANPLVIILLVASAISWVLGDPLGGIIIICIVLLSVLLNFFMEYQAGHAMEEIRKQVATTAAVLRDGKELELPIAELVRGDVIRLQAGDRVPADCRLLSAKDLNVRESALTGECLPVEKIAGELPAGKHGITDAANSVFLGTAVQTGIGTAVIVYTGKDTAFGEIAERMATRPRQTAFRINAYAADPVAGAFRFAGQHRFPPFGARVFSFFGGARCGDDAGDDAHDHHRHVGPGRAADGKEESSGEATRGHRGLRQRGNSLQR